MIRYIFFLLICSPFPTVSLLFSRLLFHQLKRKGCMSYQIYYLSQLYRVWVCEKWRKIRIYFMFWFIYDFFFFDKLDSGYQGVHLTTIQNTYNQHPITKLSHSKCNVYTRASPTVPSLVLHSAQVCLLL